MTDSIKMEALMRAMASYFGEENKDQVSHFQAVWLFAKTIAAEEKVDEKTKETVEVAAVVHDISCPLCSKKYGSTDGKLQEKESYPLVVDFLKKEGFEDSLVERVATLVSRHHTYENVDGLDLQILLEADALVNLSASDEIDVDKAIWFGANVFQTKTGKFLLEHLIGEAEEEAKDEE
ncbi:MAG: HD domain-containing protein [Spirochaetales bacterium]|nr:HD domain-containing protein [Candidatus Physcosoma equi]